MNIFGSIYDKVAKKVLTNLKNAEEYWSNTEYRDSTNKEKD